MFENPNYSPILFIVTVLGAWYFAEGESYTLYSRKRLKLSIFNTKIHLPSLELSFCSSGLCPLDMLLI